MYSICLWGCLQTTITIRYKWGSLYQYCHVTFTYWWLRPVSRQQCILKRACNLEFCDDRADVSKFVIDVTRVLCHVTDIVRRRHEACMRNARCFTACDDWKIYEYILVTMMMMMMLMMMMMMMINYAYIFAWYTDVYSCLQKSIQEGADQVCLHILMLSISSPCYRRCTTGDRCN